MIFLFACTFESPTLNWVRIDPHVHSSIGSNDTDGLGTPERIAEKIVLAGLDGVWISDHSNSQGSMHCDDVEDCPNLGPELSFGDWPENVLLASEISLQSDDMSEARGHIGCLPLQKDYFATDVFIDRPFGMLHGGDAIQACKDAQGFAILNHPFGPLPWVAFDFQSQDFDAIEVYNGSAAFDHSDAQAIAYWEAMLEEGNVYTPIAASDCHRWGTPAPGDLLNPALGWPHTQIGLYDGEEWIDGLRAGRVVLGDPSSVLMMVVEKSGRQYFPGMEAPTGSTMRIEASTEEDDLKVELILIGTGVIHTEILHEKQKIELENMSSGIYYARIMPVEESYGIRGVALTAPIVVK